MQDLELLPTTDVTAVAARNSARSSRGDTSGVIDSPLAPIDLDHALPAVLSEYDRRRVLVEWNETHVHYPPRCVQQLFEDQVDKTPDAVAVATQDATLSYAQLNARANQLASWLRSHGVGPDVCVGIYLNRSIEMIVGLLGILKAGGAYVPIDPSYPSERVDFLIHDCGAALVLTTAPLLDKISGSSCTPLCLDRDWTQIATHNLANPPDHAGLANLAYVIYTSGSTGAPKGVMIEHAALTNYVSWALGFYPTLHGRGTPLHTSIAFDLSVTALFPTLLAGRTVFLLSEEAGILALGSALASAPDYSLVKLTPAHIELLSNQVDNTCVAGGTRAFVIGGEALIGQSLTWWRTNAPAMRVINEYGPTEATVGCCVFDVPASNCPDGAVPIGRPIANTRLYVLDAHLQPVPIGVPGELFIGGSGLARGYLGRPNLTAERFIADPFTHEGGRRLYRTGDIVQHLPDGNLVYLGRTDHQVKIRGHRVELGEIESRLREYPGVREALVTAHADVHGDRQLVAYLVAADQARAELPALRDFLMARLPEPMIPTSCVWLDRFPLTHNGKVDRAALPMPDPTRPTDDCGFVAPRDATETQLCSIWVETLGIAPIGVTDSFLELGGTSLSAARAFRRIQEVFGRIIPISVLIQSPTIAQIAEILRQSERDETASSLIPLQPNGSRTPLFCVHGAGANVLSFMALATYIAPDQPFYGLQARGLDGKTEPLTTAEEMATHYITEIRSVQPTGPYLLSGLSFGGIVAFEMAQQLHRQGESVELLVLFDTNYPGRKIGLPNHHWRFQKRVYPFVESVEKQLLVLRSDGPRKFITARCQDIRKGLTRRFGKKRSGVSMNSAHHWYELAPTLQRVYRANLAAERAYVPTYYPGRVTLVWASDWSLTVIFRSGDARLRWCEVAGAGLEVHRVPGDHNTFRAEPHVGVLVQSLNRCLERAHESLARSANSGQEVFIR